MIVQLSLLGTASAHAMHQPWGLDGCSRVTLVLTALCAERFHRITESALSDQAVFGGAVRSVGWPAVSGQ